MGTVEAPTRAVAERLLALAATEPSRIVTQVSHSLLSKDDLGVTFNRKNGEQAWPRVLEIKPGSFAAKAGLCKGLVVMEFGALAGPTFQINRHASPR